ncbi:hypothetical protein MKX03_026614 [Papaver bracteatum]|nr:hypothetical protein MKX03_026614 [Papaver bracteatum]
MEKEKKKIGYAVPTVPNSKKKWKLSSCSESSHQKLPHEVIMGNILTRLPIYKLVKECALVCKLWYKSIKIEPQFKSLYLLQSCRYRNPNLIFDIYNFFRGGKFLHATYNLDTRDTGGDIDDINFVYDFSKLTNAATTCKQDLVGHCNGLVCFRESQVRKFASFLIINPCYRRQDRIGIYYPIHDDALIVCCGFGFDSLSNQYKIVLVIATTSNSSSVVIDAHDKFKCMVFTLGSKSWRESSSPNTLPIVPANITRITQKKRMIVSRMSFSRSAIYVAGALYWRVLTRDAGKDEETEMLLCFDIHDEQFQLISLPAECELKMKTAATTTITTEQQQQLVDHRLLEFKGSPCVARLQTITSGEPQQMNGNCSCKVHLYVLKDRVKSVWTRETFDVCNNSMVQGMPYSPCIPATGTATTTTTVTTGTTTTTTITTTTTTITQILCSSDRVILYWFDGKCVQFYDLRRKQLKAVKYTCVERGVISLFNPENLHQVPPSLDDDVDTTNKLIYCRRDHIDYKLDFYVQNFLLLETFVPKGSTQIKDYDKWFEKNTKNGNGVGFVYVCRGYDNIVRHCFCN